MKTIPVSALRIGMYVADLDRPWLGTPFLMQGFLIEEQAQIAQLQALCHTVQVDPTRSVGDCFAAALAEDVNPHLHGLAPGREELDFLAVVRQIRLGQVQRPEQPPRVDPHTRHSHLEEELLYSARFIDDIQLSLQKLGDSLRTDQPLELMHISEQVSQVAEGVSRNPEAILWLTRLKSTDDYSYDHAMDVSVHLMVFARFLGLPNSQVECLGVAGLMQDVGKTHLPPELLRKPEALTPAEYQLVQSHVASSLEILVTQPGMNPQLLEIIARHHERIDGSGYPRRMAGEAIGLLAEMSGLMDTYCAMIRERPYTQPVSNQRAMADLVAMRGLKFRETIVDQFIQCMGLYPIGTLVELNTGEVGVVIQQNQVRRLQPRVLILLGADKSVERYPRSIDLLMEPETPTGDIYHIRKALPENAYGIDPRDFYLV